MTTVREAIEADIRCGEFGDYWIVDKTHGMLTLEYKYTGEKKIILNPLGYSELPLEGESIPEEAESGGKLPAIMPCSCCGKLADTNQMAAADMDNGLFLCRKCFFGINRHEA